MEVNSTLRKITEYIEEKILVAVIELEFVCQTSTIVFVQKCTYAIFSLIDSRQIVTDTCKKDVSSLFESLLNHLYPLQK